MNLQLGSYETDNSNSKNYYVILELKENLQYYTKSKNKSS